MTAGFEGVGEAVTGGLIARAVEPDTGEAPSHEADAAPEARLFLVRAEDARELADLDHGTGSEVQTRLIAKAEFPQSRPNLRRACQ